MHGYTLREAAQALGVSIVTIRRYIKSGKLKARLVPTKFGESYIIEELPSSTKPSSPVTPVLWPLITLDQGATGSNPVQPAGKVISVLSSTRFVSQKPVSNM